MSCRLVLFVASFVPPEYDASPIVGVESGTEIAKTLSLVHIRTHLSSVVILLEYMLQSMVGLTVRMFGRITLISHICVCQAVCAHSAETHSNQELASGINQESAIRNDNMDQLVVELDQRLKSKNKFISDW